MSVQIVKDCGRSTIKLEIRDILFVRSIKKNTGKYNELITTTTDTLRRKYLTHTRVFPQDEVPKLINLCSVIGRSRQLLAGVGIIAILGGMQFAQKCLQ